MVHFNGSETSDTEPAKEEESEEGSSEEDDTLQVDALLQSTERSIISALQKVTLPSAPTATSAKHDVFGSSLDDAF